MAFNNKRLHTIFTEIQANLIRNNRTSQTSKTDYLNNVAIATGVLRGCPPKPLSFHHFFGGPKKWCRGYWKEKELLEADHRGQSPLTTSL